MQFRWHRVALIVSLSLGCQKFDLRSQNPEVEPDEFETRVETPLVGEYTTTAGLNMVTLEGVGLVTGLDGTGGDPPVSSARSVLLDDMRRRGVKHPNQILADPSTALVVVRAYLPPLIRKGETFDIEVRLAPNSTATSLEGGWLMETYLSERALIPGQGVMKGHVFAKAQGPILVSQQTAGDDAETGKIKRGKILAGGRSLKERELSLFLRSDYRSVRTSKSIASRIGQRFFSYNSAGIREPLAVAKTDQKIELKLHPTYKENYPRYLQVIRAMARRETEVGRRVRMQRLEDELNHPETSERAAIALEAIGSEAVPVLKSALNNKLLECRFHAAVALAYLGEPSGVTVLQEAVAEEPAFRVFALTAMAAIDESETHVALRELMDSPSAETRYGAFRALTTLDRNDPFVRGVPLNDQFLFHVVDTSGPPMVHVTHRKKSELVLFGAGQEFRRPLVLRAGKHILVTSSPGSDHVTVSRYEVGKPDMRREVSAQISEVVHTVAEFGGNYPEIVSMLIQADRQKNLPGQFAIDALPRIGRTYFRPDPDSPGARQRARIGRRGSTPNLFGLDEDDEEDVEKDQREPVEEPVVTPDLTATPEPDEVRGTASIVNVAPETAATAATPGASTDEQNVLPGEDSERTGLLARIQGALFGESR